MKPPSRRRWNIDDIPFDDIDREAIRHDEFLMLTLISASFVEVLAQTYSMNLVKHFEGNAELEQWLNEGWRHEEEQHGQSLKAYVTKVWPEFNWERAQAGFAKEYGAMCTMEELEPQRALELMARCVVETGTSTLYRTLQNYTKEPVLQQLLNNIKMDETAHYNQFRKHFLASNSVERHGLRQSLKVVLRRVLESKSEDAYIGFKHAYLELHPGANDVDVAWARHRKTSQRLARRHYPFSVAASMLLKPMPMPERLKTLLKWPVTGVVYLASFSF